MSVKEEIIINALKRENQIVLEREKILKEQISIFASPIRMMIITALHFKEEMSKTEIHNLLEKAGTNIAYKNTSINIDQLHQKGIVDYKKKGRYNATLVSLNSNKLFEYRHKLIFDQNQLYEKTKDRINKTLKSIKKRIK